MVPTEILRGDQSREENRRYNAQLMDTSKVAAATVALRRLGYAVVIHTTGTVVRNIGEDTPAAEALELDDVIVAVDGEPVDVLDELRDLLQVGGPGAAHTAHGRAAAPGATSASTCRSPRSRPTTTRPAP